jgi:hypothetical protein
MATTLCLVSQIAYCQNASGDQWHYSWTGQAWIPGYSGDLVIGDRQADIDIGVSDVLDIISDIDKKFVGTFEANRGPDGILLDVFFVGNEDSMEPTPGIWTQLELNQLMADLAYTRVVSAKELAPGAMQIIKAMVGVRYTKFDTELKIYTDTSVDFEESRDRTWTDVIIGAILEQPVAPKWMVVVRADGGIGLDDSSSWKADIGFRKEIGKQKDLVFGWRWLKEDFSEGEGVDLFEYDVLMQGPYIGLRSTF